MPLPDPGACPHHAEGRCRSCDRMGVPARERLLETARRLAEVTGVEPEEPFLSSDWGFRDKAKMTVGGDVENPILGLLAPDLTHVKELLDCPVQAQALNSELPGLRDFIRKWKLTPYDVISRRGELKGLILSHSPVTGAKMLRFVLRSREALDRIRLGLADLPGFAVVSVNLQPVPHALTEGPEEILLRGSSLPHETPGLKLAFPPQAFMQTNLAVAEGLYATAAEWACPWKGKKALDLFCGVGGFALHLARAGLDVEGVEVNPEAVEAARVNAIANQLHVPFHVAAAGDVRALWEKTAPSLVVVNPPRRGLGESLSLCLQFTPEAILYSSCDLDSFAADFSTLKQRFGAERVKIFDIFNHTSHFEVLSLLVRR